MTERQKKLINGSFKWLVTIAFVAGGLAKMISLNTATIEKHENRISDCEKVSVRLETKQEAIHEDVKDIKRMLQDR